MFHRTLGFSFAFALSVSATCISSHAQDYASPTSAPFSGPYVGASAGVAARKIPNITSGASLTAGVQAGYNYQAGPLVVGGELELGHAGGQKLRTNAGTVRQDWNGAVKAKAGIAMNETLIYGMGGFGLGKLRGNAGKTWEESKIIGGGLEQSIGNGKSFKVEYQRSRFSDVRVDILDKADLTSHAVRAGLNMRF